MDPNVHVQVFHKATHANEEKNDVDIVNLFCFILHDAISEWGKNFMRAHLVCSFKELVHATFCKHYLKIQIDEQMYMALLVIKKTGMKRWKYNINIY